jgi:alpha-D-ribose 1-methylphosphonate 5-triphosphate synthase subunit PhnH
MAENHARFPTGIDVIFAAPGLVAALPRSTEIRLLEAV